MLNDDFFKNPFESFAKEARIVIEIDRFKSFALKNGVLYYNARVYILKFINDFHNISIVGHLGFQKTYMTVKHHYYLLGMKKVV